MVQNLGRLKESPSQTAGPYVHIGCTPNFTGIDIYGGDLGTAMRTGPVKGEEITIRGTVFDGTGTPLRDAIARLEGDGLVTREIADMALTRLGVDNLGLDGADLRYLTIIAENYGGGPVGIETIAAAMSEARDAVEEVIEPFLLQQGLIQRTPRGRMLARKAWRHLGLTAPRSPDQQSLFDE